MKRKILAAENRQNADENGVMCLLGTVHVENDETA